MRVLKVVLAGLSASLLFLSAAFAAPRITGFDVEQARRLIAGSALVFTLRGTPGGAASVSIAGVSSRLLLDEVEAGVYETTYTIKKNDRFTATTEVTANLRVGNEIATDVLDESLLAGGRLRTSAGTANPKIDRLEVDPPARLAPGEQLYFTVHGTPAGKASIRIAGVRGKLFVDEVHSGVYEAAYTIKERDRIAPNAAVWANLHVGNRDANATLNRPLLAGPAPVPSARRVAQVCTNCGVVEAVNAVQVNGDGSYIGKIGGGVVGGLLGSQIGSGNTATVAAVVGAVGGAFAGNEIEKRVRKTSHYDVVVRLQGGGAQTVSYPTQPAFKTSDKVRVENGVLVAG